jgi:transposase
MKEAARHRWSYQTRGWARRGWDRLNDWMAHARLAPTVKTSRTRRDHLLGIIHAVVLDVTNAHLEVANAKIQALEKRARGYRNRDRFRDAIAYSGASGHLVRRIWAPGPVHLGSGSGATMFGAVVSGAG